MKRFLKKYIPVTFVISLFILGAACALLEFAEKDADFADVLSGGAGAVIRGFLASATSLISVSVAEIFVVFLVILALALIPISIFCFRRARTRVRLLFHLLSFVFVMYSGYAVSFGASYHTSPIETKMDFEICEINEERLYELSLYLVGRINELSENTDTPSEMGYGIDELSEKCAAAYEAFIGDYPIFENQSSRIKPVMLSRLMAYGGILGMYTYFTGEANICTVCPDYCIPASALHELAHARGVAREDEANFISFAVAEYSDDEYVRYSGYLNLFEYTVSALRKTDKAAAAELYAMLSEGVISDMRAYSDFYNAHKVTLIRDISNFFNDTYLKLNGTEGVVSYGRVVRLSVSYYKHLGIIE